MKQFFFPWKRLARALYILYWYCQYRKWKIIHFYTLRQVNVAHGYSNKTKKRLISQLYNTVIAFVHILYTFQTDKWINFYTLRWVNDVPSFSKNDLNSSLQITSIHSIFIRLRWVNVAPSFSKNALHGYTKIDNAMSRSNRVMFKIAWKRTPFLYVETGKWRTSFL